MQRSKPNRLLRQRRIWLFIGRAIERVEAIWPLALIFAAFVPGLAGGFMLLLLNEGEPINPQAFMAGALFGAAALAAIGMLVRLMLPRVRFWCERKWNVFRLIHGF